MTIRVIKPPALFLEITVMVSHLCIKIDATKTLCKEYAYKSEDLDKLHCLITRYLSIRLMYSDHFKFAEKSMFHVYHDSLSRASLDQIVCQQRLPQDCEWAYFGLHPFK